MSVERAQRKVVPLTTHPNLFLGHSFLGKRHIIFNEAKNLIFSS